MFEALTAKVFATVVSLSMFLFSSYTGNDPAFRALNAKAGVSYLQFRTTLVAAFDNDFPDVFKSGASIPVDFTLQIKSGNKIRLERKYQNKVQYNPSTGIYYVFIAGMNRNLQTESYQQMLSAISGFECSVPYDSAWGKVSVHLEAKLPTVRFQQINKAVDLMVLWRYQRPSITTYLNLLAAT
ncbi:MAG: hypothetical protein RBS43_09855 [Candidatus Cloacimonas sp.]|jgi:hypothetical protein|nr:hypothetical protein [Candidatus Cloacimonas sp.]